MTALVDDASAHYPTPGELCGLADQVLDALDTGCTTGEVRASAETLRGAVDAETGREHKTAPL